MKLLSEKQKKRYNSRAKRRWKQRLHRRIITYFGKTGNNNREVRLLPPSILSFTNNYEDTVNFLDQLRRRSLAPRLRGETVYVDLSQVTDISISVSIVLAADFQRWAILKGRHLRPRDISSWSPKVINLFNDLGVFKLLGVPDQLSNEERDSFTLSPLQSGLKTEGEKIHRMQARFSNILDGFTEKSVLYDGLVEAAENAISHAYPRDYKPIHKYAGHRWWGASCLDFRTKSLRFFIFDQGAGIPHTLPRSGIWELIRRQTSELSIGLLNDDGYILEKAFELGRTATMDSNRGLGLNRMLQVTETGPGCKFRVLSGKAEISCTSGSQIEKLTRTRHIGGTLIEWSIPSIVFTDSEEDEIDD